MKKLMIMITLGTTLASFNANALQAIAASYAVASLAMTSLGVTSSVKGLDCTLGQGACKEAAQVIEDTQNYQQSGQLSAFLSQKIKDIQSLDSSVSDEEALDALTSVSAQMLKL
ncbi:MAG: hypothetical protein H7177_08755 [Rhizobacter sp.]|nr:hypothetical protein [Bacteriovorax sp.]